MRGFLVPRRSAVLRQERSGGKCVSALAVSEACDEHFETAVVVVAVALALLFTFDGAIARAQIATATLTGSVRDETGAALPGVDVTVRSVATGVTRTTITDSEGRYRIPRWIPASPRVRAELEELQGGDSKRRRVDRRRHHRSRLGDGPRAGRRAGDRA